jgi:hypothetical protein
MGKKRKKSAVLFACVTHCLYKVKNKQKCGRQLKHCAIDLIVIQFGVQRKIMHNEDFQNTTDAVGLDIIACDSPGTSSSSTNGKTD